MTRGWVAGLLLFAASIPARADAPDSYDRIVPALMKKWDVNGGAVAVSREGKLLLARGYGLADVEAQEPVKPTSLFRIASLSKAITATAILRLVERGRLKLDDKVFDALEDLKPSDGFADPRLGVITIRQLLQHSGGWDRDASFDPMFEGGRISKALGLPGPPDADDVARYMTGMPLQFAPGTRYAYSNFGYLLLGRVIEKLSGQSYGSYVRANVLKPAGAGCMRLGRTALYDRAPGEVRYYSSEGRDPNGDWSIEAMDSHGGWLASAVDLLRFVDSIEGAGKLPRLLTPESVAAMTARPAPPLWAGSDHWYGMGWEVRAAPGGFNWWHTGSLDGTTTLMVRAGNGFSWVALFNGRPKDKDGFAAELDREMWRAFKEAGRGLDGDHFADFPPCR
jgi:N-acyl-D-amino-acid deacylase